MRALVVVGVLCWAATSGAVEPDARAALRAIGPQHVEPVRFAATASRPETWLGVIGDVTHSQAAYIARIEGGKPRALGVQAWPLGTRVIGVEVQGDRAWALLEPPRSIAKRDPIAVALMLDYREAPMVAPAGPGHLEVFGARTMEELKTKLAAARPSGREAITEDQARSLMKAPQRAIAPTGFDVYRIHQATWLEHIAHVDAGAAAKSPWLERTKKLVLAAGTECAEQVCSAQAPGPMGSVDQIVWERREDRWVVRALLILPDPKAQPRSVAAARPVPVRGDGARTRAAAGAQMGSEARTLVEGPLDAQGGIIGVAEVAHRPVVVATIDGVDRAYTIEEDPWANPTGPPTLEADLVDADGDGRSDVVLWTNSGENPRAPFAAVFLAPAPSLDVFSLSRDLVSELALVGATSAKDASARVLALSREGPTPAEVCTILRGASGRALWKRVAAWDAVALRFSGFVPITYQAELARDKAITDTDLQGFGTRCKRLSCQGPVCAHGIDDNLDDRGKHLRRWAAGWYWWKRDGGAWRVAGYGAFPNGISEASGVGGGAAAKNR